MFAVIKSGGKQYRVVPNDVITVERLPGEVGETVAFDQVLMLGEGASATVGAPLVAGAQVSAEVLSQTLGDKIVVFKKRRRKDYRRRKGHRQALTVVRITEISADGKPAAKKAKAAPKAQPEAAPEVQPEAADQAAAAAPAEAPAAKKPAATKPAAKKPAAKKATAKKAAAKKVPAKKAAKAKAGKADGAKEKD